MHREGKDDADWFHLHLGNLIQEAVGVAAATEVTSEVLRVDGHEICRIHTDPSAHPVRMRGNGDAFYVRRNNATVAIKDEAEVEKYVSGRWPGKSTVAHQPPLKLVSRDQAEPFVRHVPVFSLAAAAGGFLENRPIEEIGWTEIIGHRLRKGMFVARVEGHSMEPRIQSGSYCLFRADAGGGPLAGTRQGKVVLVALRNAVDPEHGAGYTVKVYRRTQEVEGSGDRRSPVMLDSLNPSFQPITVSTDQDISILAEFIDVVGHESDWAGVADGQ